MVICHLSHEAINIFALESQLHGLLLVLTNMPGIEDNWPVSNILK